MSSTKKRLYKSNLKYLKKKSSQNSPLIAFKPDDEHTPPSDQESSESESSESSASNFSEYDNEEDDCSSQLEEMAKN